MSNIVTFEIRAAEPEDLEAIRRLYHALNRPKRRIRAAEYLVASSTSGLIGCAGVRAFPGGGYLYGLAVERASQRRGVGSGLTLARLARVKDWNAEVAIAMAMFWNVGFFRRLGFESMRREDLPGGAKRLGDFRNPVYKHSAVLRCILQP